MNTPNGTIFGELPRYYDLWNCIIRGDFCHPFKKARKTRSLLRLAQRYIRLSNHQVLFHSLEDGGDREEAVRWCNGKRDLHLLLITLISSFSINYGSTYLLRCRTRRCSQPIFPFEDSTNNQLILFNNLQKLGYILSQHLTVISVRLPVSSFSLAHFRTCSL